MTRRLTELQMCSLATEAGPIAYHLRRSGRRRTMEISIDEACRVCVTAPRFVAAAEIEKFIHVKASWIIRKLREVTARQTVVHGRRYEDGHEFLFLGRPYPLRIERTDRRTADIWFDGTQWRVNLPVSLTKQEEPPAIKKRLSQWYRRQAGEILGGRVFHFARLMGQEPAKIAVKTQKRIWGSCAHHSRTINLNWHLVLAPLEVIDYVVVHELSHLEVPNHSRRFWRRVQGVLPDYQQRSQWLREHALEMKLP